MSSGLSRRLQLGIVFGLCATGMAADDGWGRGRRPVIRVSYEHGGFMGTNAISMLLRFLTSGTHSGPHRM